MTEILELPLSLQRVDLKSADFVTTREITPASETGSSLLEALTLPEKVSLLSGSSFVATSGVKRLGIPALKTVDGVSGVKGSQTFDGVKTLCFPSTGCVGATWNRDLAHKMGVAVARQAKSKAAQVVLGPAMNIHRDPRAGRNFECFSEDPLVTGLLAASIVNGIQGEGVSSCPKHFVANDSETKRRFYDVKESVDGRAIREIYLGAFQTMLRYSDPMSLMTAYNKIDGHFASENTPLIKDVLRDQWGYQGCLMSDWYGTRSGLSSLNAGLDLEMPGPSVFRGASLVDDVASGRVSESLVDQRVANVLKLIERTKQSHSDAAEESLFDDQACQIAREIATEGIVMLQNRKAVLPLRMEKIAVIGESSIVPAIGGGGSAEAPPQYIIRPVDSIRGNHPTPEHVSSHPGVKIHNALPMIPSDQMYAMDGSSGIDIQYFNNGIDAPVYSERLAKPHVVMLGRVRPGLHASEFHYTVSTCLVAKTTGTHTIGIQATGNFVLEVNEKEVLRREMKGVSVEDFLFKPKHLERTCNVSMIAGVPYFIKLTVQNHPGMGTGEPCVHAAKLCYIEDYSNNALIEEAVSVARAADVSIIFAGRTSEHESEGFDLQDLKLPRPQVEMIKTVAAASRRSVLVLSGGNPIDVQDFVEDVDTILFTHFLGQESGPALAEILYGKCPSGRLATTWPKTLEDTPSFAHFPAKDTPNGFEISYAEGINIGYRSSMVPQWPFGFGLSYTTFAFSDLRITRYERTFEVQLTVTNSGAVAGSEVVQVYVTEVAPDSTNRPKELKAFTKVHLEPRASATVELSLDINHSFSAWSEQEKLWVAEAGDYRVDVGGLSETVNLQQAIRWSGL